MQIAEVANSNPACNKYGTNCGNNTIDKVYLLSLDEAELYISGNDGKAKYDGEFSQWWLQSPGSQYHYRAADVGQDGLLNIFGDYVVASDVGVRPTIRIKYNIEK